MESTAAIPSAEALNSASSSAEINTAIFFVSGIIICTVVIALLCKVYAVLTEGRYTCKKDLRGKVIIVTGSNTGLGKTTAKALAGCGARVILACRNMEKAEAARMEIMEETGSKNVVCMKLDLASFRSVREFARDVYANEERVDVLINNAGLLTPSKHELTEDGVEVSIQSNHLGHFLLSNLLLDLLKKSAPSRVVVVGSCGQWFGNMNPDKELDFKRYYCPLINYCSTKVLNMLFTVELSKRLQGSGVTVNCGHPGYVHSNFGVTEKTLQAWIFTKVLQCYGKTPEVGAMTSVYLATSDDVSTVSGKYFADCHRARAPYWATNDTKATKLWQVSQKMTDMGQMA